MNPKVHLFIPCYIDQLYPKVGIATVEILESLGCTLVYPEQQTCCGQPFFNSGYWKVTLPLAEQFLHLFSSAEYVVAPSGSCITMAKHMYGDLSLPPELHKTWVALRDRMYEFSQFLEKVIKIDRWRGRFSGKMTYHDSCHGLRELGISEYPRQLLRSIEDLELVEMERSDTCCGFGGTFSVKYADISGAMMEQKARWIQESGAEIVVATDSSCLMHMEGYFQKHNIPIRTMHLVEVLWKAIQP